MIRVTRASRPTRAGTREGVALRYQADGTTAMFDLFMLPDEARDLAAELTSLAHLAERSAARPKTRGRGL